MKWLRVSTNKDGSYPKFLHLNEHIREIEVCDNGVVEYATIDITYHSCYLLKHNSDVTMNSIEAQEFLKEHLTGEN